ncbi:unnamed protein product [Phytomonas sp. Hart1]|nr:unnamed protein product [Phytomonas sp. Hart1]|eukprot:CCW71953.1 unnamed protein product [Phytomonas sp. isolate Hart1]
MRTSILGLGGPEARALSASSTALRGILQRVPPTTLSMLPNGVRVAVEAHPLARIATVGLWLDAGTRDEDSAYAGTARALQRCGLFGTERGGHRQLKAAVDRLGGQLGLTVGRERSYLYLNVEKTGVKDAVGVLADILRNTDLSDENLARAKEEARADLRRFEENPQELVMDNLHRCAYGSTSHGLGTPLYGNEEGIGLITREQLNSYRSRFFTGKRVVVVGTGCVDHTELEESAREYLGDLVQGSQCIPDVPSSEFVGGEYRLWNMRYNTVNVAWAFQTCGAACGDIVPLSLASEIPWSFEDFQDDISSNAVNHILKVFSPLHNSEKMKEKINQHGIKVVNSFIETYKDVGLCGMYIVGSAAQKNHKNAGVTVEVMHHTISQWCRFAQLKLPEDELEKAKINLKFQLLLAMDNNTESAKDIGKQILQIGRRVPLLEMYDRIDSTTATDIQGALMRYFYGTKPVFSYLGCLSHTPNYEWTQYWTCKHWY